MYAPVFFPPAPAPSPEVLAAEQAILEAEGPLHVAGAYYAREGDAAMARRRIAERVVRDAQWRAQWVARSAERWPFARPRVATLLNSRERTQVDAACETHLDLFHRRALPAVRADLANGVVDAALVSVAVLEQAHLAGLATLVRTLPASHVVGLIADVDEPHAIIGALRLGHVGIGTVIDARTPAGLGALRGAFHGRQMPDAFMRAALAAVVTELRDEASERGGDEQADSVTAPSPDGLLDFFRAVFSPRTRCAKELAAQLGVIPSTLMSRFFRAGLPSPKKYLAAARLVWAAHLAESPGLTINAIALRLDASSPQSFGRTVRTVTGLTATEFRRTYTGAAMLDHFRATLVAPYRATLRTFDPLAVEDRTQVRARSPETSTPAADSYVTSDTAVAGRAA